MNKRDKAIKSLFYVKWDGEYQNWGIYNRETDEKYHSFTSKEKAQDFLLEYDDEALKSIGNCHPDFQQMLINAGLLVGRKTPDDITSKDLIDTVSPCDCGTTVNAHSVFCPQHPGNKE